ncbi:MAG: hypothetical protein MUF18_21380 [Fimbriiglobus sp.]|jgi:hypothetical protein|nr:hypothetical protein [Fimbriiglobus sp.]
MTAPIRYLVRRQEFAPSVAGVQRVLPEKWATVATFAKPADAHAECAKLLAHARRTLNPFQLGGPSLFYQTSLPPYAFHDYLLDHGLTPPPTALSSSPNYVFWWVKNNRTFTDDDRAVVWRACDKLKVFDVTEEDDRQAAWLVVENEWLDENRARYFDSEGPDQRYRVQVAERFEVREVHRSRRDASRAEQQLAALLREESEDDGVLYFDAEGKNHEWAAAPLFSVRKVPAVGDLNGSSAFVVARRRLADEPTSLPRWEVWEQLGYGNGRELLFAVGDGESADGHLVEMVRKARRTVNPFALIGDEFTRRPLATHAVTDAEPDELPNGLSVEDAFATLRRLDTTPPPPDADDLLAGWYDQVVQWSPEFVDVIWGTFADFRLFEVVEVPFG